MNEPGTEYDNHERCQCGKPEQGYAERGKDGKFHPSCWACVKPVNPPPRPEPKKKIVYVPEKDLDAEPPKAKK